MNAVGKSLLRLADDISLAMHNAGISFGFLGDGRDLIEISEGVDGRIARFPDHSDEGWPEVHTALPGDARFQYAASGPLSRVALWTVARAESEVVKRLSSRTDGPAFKPRVQGGAIAKLGPGATVQVKGASGAVTVVRIKQTRAPEAIGEVLRNRYPR